jgi:anti-sigma B factor antagonist
MADFYYGKLGKNEDIVSVTLSGELDAFQCDYVFKCIEKQVKHGTTKLIIDCNDLSYISSAGLGMLMRVHTRMKKLDGDVKLARVRGVIAKMINLVGMNKVIQLYPTVDEAVAAHGG